MFWAPRLRLPFDSLRSLRASPWLACHERTWWCAEAKRQVSRMTERVGFGPAEIAPINTLQEF
jgi:hypothetical protein